MLVEICATSVQSALNAEKGGAKRIEICSELAVGGVTPSFGLIKEILKGCSLPAFVLVRPRSGDFVYSDNEFAAIKSDIEICKELGCAGIVSGILKEDGSVDLIRTKELVEWSKPLEFTFHRAFDLADNPFEALNQIISSGASRILTSGQKGSAEEGLDLLMELKERAQNKLTILPGGGINPENVHLFRDYGFAEIHASASFLFKQTPKRKISMNSEKFFDETKRFVSSEHIIRKIVENS